MVTRQYARSSAECVQGMGVYDFSGWGGMIYPTHPQVSREANMLTRFLNNSSVSSSLLADEGVELRAKSDCWTIWVLGKSLDLSCNHMSQRNEVCNFETEKKKVFEKGNFR